MILTLDDIRERVSPVAARYGLRAVYVFGSYARNEATEESDVDLLIDRTGSAVKGMFDLGELYNELSRSVGKEIDLVTTHTLAQQSTRRRMPQLTENLVNERVLLYGEQ